MGWGFPWAGRRRNLKLFDARYGPRLETSRPLSFRHSLDTTHALCAPREPRFRRRARDGNRNRGVWQGTAIGGEGGGGRGSRREKVYFTTDLLSRHARILSKLGEGEG